MLKKTCAMIIASVMLMAAAVTIGVAPAHAVVESYTASTGFSTVQGQNNWYYQEWDGTAYTDLTWSAVDQLWKGSATYLYVGSNLQHPEAGKDAIRKWVAPHAGDVRITGTARKADTGGGDGVIVKILKNAAAVWGPTSIAYNDAVGVSHDFIVSVNTGDVLYFSVNMNTANNWYDKTEWDPTIAYVDYTKLSGTAFGTTPAFFPGREYDKASDGDINTYFDYANPDGAYTGIDLGAGNASQITKIRFYPRTGWGSRMYGGKFQGSNTSSTSGYTDLHTINYTVNDQWYDVAITDPNSYRYLRYVGPDFSYGNIAEMEFYTDAAAQPSEVQVDLSGAFHSDGFSFDTNRSDGSLGLSGSTYAAELVPASVSFNNVAYQIGPTTNGANNYVWARGQTISLPQGHYDVFRFLASAINGTKTGKFKINYTDGSSTEQTIAVKDWCVADPGHDAYSFAHRHAGGGDDFTTNYFHQYDIVLNNAKTVSSVTLPYNFDMSVFAATLTSGGTIPNPSLISPPSGSVTADVVLGTTPVAHGLTIAPTDSGTATVVNVGGREGWQLNHAGNPYGISVDVDDNLINGGENVVYVSVDYYDNSLDGTFTLQYDSATLGDPWRQSEVVHLTGTNTWRTYTFILKDAQFANGQWGEYDFVLRLWGPAMKASLTDVIFGKIAVTKEVPLYTIEGSSAEPGNIFTTADSSLTIDLKLANQTATNQNLSIQYAVLHPYGHSVFSGSTSQSVNAMSQAVKTIDLSALNHVGPFRLRVTVSDGSYSVMRDIPFSRLLQTSGDDRIGTNSHLTFKDDYGLWYDLAKLPPVAKLGGNTMMRETLYWHEIEQTQGQYTFPAEYDDIIDAILAQGMEPVAVLAYRNPLYDNNGTPGSPTAIAAYADFAAAVAQHYNGKIKYFEIMNEWNLVGHPEFNPSSLGPEVYADLIQAAYPAIKSANPNAVVAGGVMYYPDASWLNTVFSNGAFNAMDAVSFHYYTFSGSISPEDDGSVAKIQGIRNVMTAYGTAKPIWITEYGWPSSVSGEASLSELRQAAWEVRHTAISIAEGGIAKMLKYQLQDVGLDAYSGEDRTGAIRNGGDDAPFSAKPTFAAFNVLTAKLAGAAFVQNYGPDANLYVYKFHRASDNKDILMIWNRNASRAVNLNLGAASAVETEMYGDSWTVNASGGMISVTAGEDPIYLEGTFPTVTVQ